MTEPSRLRAVRPRLLVSVRDADEAETACAAGVDLVDAKDPDRGALGALPREAIRAIVDRVGTRAATSAVAEADDLGAAPGVDYVKIALPPDLSYEGLTALAAAAPTRLIAVLFAENPLPPDAVAVIASAGFQGAMIDTRGKAGCRLTDLLAPDRLVAFVASCRRENLICGLAGSLRISDIPALAALGPDYLGFRGGLCRDGNRRAALDPLRVAQAVEAVRGLRRHAAA